ncbi:MAG: PQQ-binding-like beta-propeller repeat protein [Sedimentisphaerales bacterium]|nr:PQQ-binding-like beta-propeller repeat protein [Sedimentisphaerales bacterium]
MRGMTTLGALLFLLAAGGLLDAAPAETTAPATAATATDTAEPAAAAAATAPSMPLIPADRAAAQWPCWRGPRHDGKSPDTGLLKQWPEFGPKLLWKVPGLGVGFSSVAVAGGWIFTSGDIGDRLVMSVFGLDGRLIGKVPVDEAWSRSSPGARSTPTVDRERVYLLSGHGLLVCMQVETGRRIWQQDLAEFGGRPGEWGYAESVLIFQDLAIAKCGGDNCLMAFDKFTGRPLWSTEGFRAGPEYSSCIPLHYQDVWQIVAGTREGIIGIWPETGEVLWHNDWSAGNTANCPDAVFADGYVFWANGYGKGGICLRLSVLPDRILAEPAWTSRDMVCHHGGYIVHEGYIYGNHDNGWSCLELKSGRTMWIERGVGKGSICFADGMLYLFSEQGGRAALATCSPEGLEIRGTVAVQGEGPSWAHPVVIGGRLYLRYADSLYCFDVRDPSARPPQTPQTPPNTETPPPAKPAVPAPSGNASAPPAG